MPTTIEQTVRFGVSPDVLFDTYLDAPKHSAAINSKVSISKKVGGTFEIMGALSGKNLAIVRKRMIVQSWRASDWKESDLDSILILTFDRAGKGARMTMVHANVPDRVAGNINAGWHTYYWKPWKAYLKHKARRG